MIIGLSDRDGAFGRRTGETDRADQLDLCRRARQRLAGARRRVDRAVARQFAARARQEAVRLNRRATTKAPGGCSRRPRGGSVATRRRSRAARPIDELGTEEETFAAPMAEPRLKEAHFASANTLRSRDATGRSVKRG